jgi:hypothetical protein
VCLHHKGGACILEMKFPVIAYAGNNWLIMFLMTFGRRRPPTEAKYMDDLANGPLPHYELQLIAFKATANKEVIPDKVAQVEAANLNEDVMALVIKRFKTTLMGRKDYPNKNTSGESVHASSAVGPVILLLNVPIMKMTRTKTRKGRRSSIERRRARHTSARNGT